MKCILQTAFQVLSIIAAIGCLVAGFYHPVGILISCILFVAFGGLGMAVMYHRFVSHRAFRPIRMWKIAGLAFGYIGSQMAPIDWASQHALHHRHVDTDGDPHSPLRLGWRAAFYWFHGSDKPIPTMTIQRALIDLDIRWFQAHGHWVVVGYVSLMIAMGAEAFVYMWLYPCALTHVGQIRAVFNHDKSGPGTHGSLNGLLTAGEHNHAAHHANPGDVSGDGVAALIISAIRTRPSEVTR